MVANPAAVSVKILYLQRLLSVVQSNKFARFIEALGLGFAVQAFLHQDATDTLTTCSKGKSVLHYVQMLCHIKLK